MAHPFFQQKIHPFCKSRSFCWLSPRRWQISKSAVEISEVSGMKMWRILYLLWISTKYSWYVLFASACTLNVSRPQLCNWLPSNQAQIYCSPLVNNPLTRWNRCDTEKEQILRVQTEYWPRSTNCDFFQRQRPFSSWTTLKQASMAINARTKKSKVANAIIDSWLRNKRVSAWSPALTRVAVCQFGF